MPGNSDALATQAAILCEHNRVAEGMAIYARRSALVYGGEARVEPGEPPHKKRHDLEQRNWLADQGVAVVEGQHHAMGGERLALPAVNPLNSAAISGQWQSSHPQLVVVDDLLTQEALESLRRFC